MRVILRRSDDFCTNNDPELNCCRGSQQGDKRVLDRRAALPARF